MTLYRFFKLVLERGQRAELAEESALQGKIVQLSGKLQPVLARLPRVTISALDCQRVG